MRYLLLWAMFVAKLALPCVNDGSPINECAKSDIVEVSDRTLNLASRFEKDIERGRLKERTNFALNAIVKLAVWKLRRTGNTVQADKLQDEWEGQWEGYLLKRDLGDHKPLSKWLAEKYAMLEFILGEAVCEMLRLTDIKIINYGIPVVFSCVDNVDVDEFYKHFVPLSGTTIYWVTVFGCVGATWGSGFLFCAPVGMGAELLTEKFVAPKLNPKVWKWSCQ